MTSLLYRVFTPLIVRKANSLEPSLEAARKREVAPEGGYRPKDAVITREVIAGVTVERYRPVSGTTHGTVLYVHGGAWLAGSAAGSRRWSIGMMRRLGAEVISVDYRLAPEFPFPAGLLDVYAVYREVRATAGRLVLAGESAGSNLSLGVLQKAHADGVAMPEAAVLLYPGVDGSRSGASIKANAGKDILTPAGLDWAVDLYLDGHDPLDPLVSPLYADLSYLPSTFVQVGDRDLLLDDSRRLAAKLVEEGVDCTLSVWPGMVHGWAGVATLVRESIRAVDEAAAWAAPHLTSDARAAL